MNGIFQQKGDLNMSENKHSRAFCFYKGRIAFAGTHNLVSGDALLEKIINCAKVDSALSYEEYKEVMELVDRCHRKLMEVNFNEGWN